MSNPIQIRLLAAPDTSALREVRLTALTEAPRAFGSSMEEEELLGLDHFLRLAEADEKSAVLGAFAEGRMVGMTCISQYGKLKARHKAFIWGVYVDPEHRGRGLARQLLQAALARAATMPGVRRVHLTAAADNTAAMALYADLGFVEYGREPDSLCVNGELIDEVLMSRVLR
ncbi:GNAT family N-acetyltransferase [Bordetella sp. FB-8]|uniref:GNAT family N-acetyltransferase n=1 Tax=Bordetella sp. FB-8 TaxID=1159870 RepID=UPI00035E4108|nr:GNAT family N-acetyltransferase [Bordetella sp. FB-8]